MTQPRREPERVASGASDPVRDAVIDLPPAPESAAHARRFVARTLRSWPAVSRFVDTATLLVSEVVGNSVRHAHSPVSVHVQVDAAEPAEPGRPCDERVLVAVRDDDEELPVTAGAEPTLDAESGRGVWLLGVLARRWGAEPAPPRGKKVWFEL